MFGPKKQKSTKKQVGISVKTMESDLKGEGGKNVAVEYDGGQSETKNANESPSDNTMTKQAENPQSKEDFHSPFNNNSLKENLSVNKEQATIPQKKGIDNTGTGIARGTFPKTPSGSESLMTEQPPTKKIDNNIPFAGESKSEDSAMLSADKQGSSETPFLHTATGMPLDNQKDKPTISQTKNKPQISQKNSHSIIWIIAFILILASILLGGYYFYMTKDSKKEPQQPPKNNTKKDVGATNTKTDTTNRATEVNNGNQNTNSTQPDPSDNNQNNNLPPESQKVIDRFITTENTFESDLKAFITDLKTQDNTTALSNGLLVSPMKNAETPLVASELLKAVAMDDVLTASDLKTTTKLFVAKDNSLVRVALMFELKDGVDDKIVKNQIIQKEDVLPAKMITLFVDGEKPTLPTDVKFAVNPNNQNSRYFNYNPPQTISSVDWNILDLGQGKIIYFATSKNLAEKITDYFMKVVAK
jgi:hypothetical protein